MLLAATQLKKSLDTIMARVKAAAGRSGRNPDEVRVVAVTKTVGVETLKMLDGLGWNNIGENRVPDALEKAAALPSNKFVWHMVGHLQTNKVKKAVRLFDYIHSADSLHLAEEIHKEALKIGKTIRIMIQVNTSAEASKSGIRPEEAVDLYREIKETLVSASGGAGGIIIGGLMTMAPITDNSETVRPYFRKLRELRDELKSKFTGTDNPDELKYLSMGMSQDFEVAVEEGANMLRIGTAIFS